MSDFSLNQQDCNEVNTFLKSELAQAGIHICDSIVMLSKEVGSSISGNVGPWSFRREHCHWIAEGPGLLHEDAIDLQQRFPDSILAGGCQSPVDVTKQFYGFAIPVYHITNVEALKAFADKLKEIMQRASAH